MRSVTLLEEDMVMEREQGRKNSGEVIYHSNQVTIELLIH